MIEFPLIYLYALPSSVIIGFVMFGYEISSYFIKRNEVGDSSSCYSGPLCSLRVRSRLPPRLGGALHR